MIVPLGQIAWDAYRNAVEGRSYEGEALPKWEGLGIVQQHGWAVAAAAVRDAVLREEERC